jgi:hypothetical protein
MSPRQANNAVRVNRVPRDEFEQAVESDDPPTVTELAEHGSASFANGGRKMSAPDMD